MWKERLARVRVDIETRRASADDYLAVVRDISLSGCLLATRARLKQAQQVPLAVPLAGGGELRLTGTVVRGREGAGEGWGGYGVRFDPMAEEARRALELLMAEGGGRPAASELRSPAAATCGRNHRHSSQEQSDGCEARFAARQAHRRAADEEKARAASDPAVRPLWGIADVR